MHFIICNWVTNPKTKRKRTTLAGSTLARLEFANSILKTGEPKLITSVTPALVGGVNKKLLEIFALFAVKLFWLTRVGDIPVFHD